MKGSTETQNPFRASNSGGKQLPKDSIRDDCKGPGNMNERAYSKNDTEQADGDALVWKWSHCMA